MLKLQTVGKDRHARAYQNLHVMGISEPAWDYGGQPSIPKKFLEKIMLVSEQNKG